MRIRRNPPRGEAREVIHNQSAGAGAGGRRNSSPPLGGGRRASSSRSNIRIPGPFWVRPRGDERREVDVLRRRKFEVRSEARDVIHGEGPSSFHAVDGRRRSDFSCKGRVKTTNSGTRLSGPFWLRQRTDERREIDAPRRKRFEGQLSEVREVVHGGGPSGPRRKHPFDIPSICRPTTGPRAPGPFWTRQRTDERREPDVNRIKRLNPQSEVQDIVHGEEGRAQVRQGQGQRPMDIYDLPPGPSHADPFWMLERQDERRDPDIDRKKKFGRQRIEAAEVIHGEDFRAQWDQRDPRADGEDDDDDEDDQAEHFPFRKACSCAPGPPNGMLTGGWDDWTPSDNYEEENAMAYERQRETPRIPRDVEKAIRDVPAARVSCAPQAEVSQFDQPNTFMKKLYEKYPYLYQVLKETPPDELVSRVFKDRFLSTYQVDYLHLGIGKEQVPAGGAHIEEKMTGPDGEPEPETIPGCSYRYSEKGDYGRKKYEQKTREKEEEEEVKVEKEEPWISEYMATVSKLGGEIVSDQLYKVAQITKNMKNQYRKL